MDKSLMPRGNFAYNLLYKVLYMGRDTLQSSLFTTVKKYCKGEVLDVGGRDFFHKALAQRMSFSKWTTVETSKEEYYPTEDVRHRFVIGDGCALKFANNSFDTVLVLHVLEHVFEPLKMVAEASRVLKKGGHAVFLIPCSATLHMAPDHYYNFTRFWIEKAIRNQRLNIVELRALGGLWQTIAARYFYFFLKSARVSGMSTRHDKRNVFFYLLFPVATIYALASMPLALLFSTGDLTEDPNDFLVVAKKK